VVTFEPPGLTFAHRTLRPQSTFMFFLWISEQTAIISQYGAN